MDAGEEIEIGSDETLSSALAKCAKALRRFGVKACTYHLTPPFHSQVGKKSVVYHYGFPRNIVAEYLDPEVFETDPSPDYVMHAGRTMTWTQAIEGRDLTEAQHSFVQRCRDWGYTTGLSIPLFGPNSMNSYAALMFDAEAGIPDEESALQIIDFAQFSHRKMCIIMNRDKERRIALSRREEEVLYWVARGKSNADIATILDLSDGTIGTFIKRLFLKLGVHGRVAATIEGLSRGIVHLG